MRKGYLNQETAMKSKQLLERSKQSQLTCSCAGQCVSTFIRSSMVASLCPRSVIGPQHGLSSPAEMLANVPARQTTNAIPRNHSQRRRALIVLAFRVDE
jgi:hypothetical protein